VFAQDPATFTVSGPRAPGEQPPDMTSFHAKGQSEALATPYRRAQGTTSGLVDDVDASGAIQRRGPHRADERATSVLGATSNDVEFRLEVVASLRSAC